MTYVEKLRGAGLTDIEEYGDSIVCDMRYATTDNLTGEILYDHPACFLREPAAKALNQVQRDLYEQGVGLKIWDAYRPMSVQAKLAAFVSNTDYTPSVSNHSRGIALDVTLVDRNTGAELVMPTVHDDLSEAAHENAPVDDPEALRNRELLKAAMHAHGFTVYPFEWWHFDYLALADAEPLDIAI